MIDFIKPWSLVIFLLFIAFMVSLATPSIALKALLMMLLLASPIVAIVDYKVLNQQIADAIKEL